MPELPEVEIVKQSLNQKIKYKKIQKIIIRNRNLRFKLSPKFEKVFKTLSTLLLTPFTSDTCELLK